MTVFDHTFTMLLMEINTNYERWDRCEPESPKTNETDLSSFVHRKLKELSKLSEQRPAKTFDPQTYYIFRAREEQIKFELDLRASGREALQGYFFDAIVLYGHALNHLKRRTEYEQKAYAVWIQRMQDGESPPSPDITFVNQGYHLNQII